MNRIIVMALATLLPTLLFAQRRAIKEGNIKSVIVYEQKFDGKGIATQVKDSELKFDVNGNEIESIEYKDGKVDKHFTFQYDENDNKIRETELEPNGNIRKITDIQYNNNNQKVKETEINVAGKVLKVVEYTYEDNLKSEKTVYEGGRKLKSKKRYKYETF